MRNRKKKNGENRLTNLSSLLITREDLSGLPASGGFADGAPLRLEIGCGKGDFVTGLARKEPDYGYIAVERVPDVALIALEKYAGSRGLGKLGDHGEWIRPDGTALKGERWEIPTELSGNVRFYIGKAEDFLDEVPPDAFEGIYLNFSDPWSKKGYASRRLTHPSYLKKYSSLLNVSGRIYVKTDNDGLFEFTLESLGSEGWTVEFMTRDLHSPSVPEQIRSSNVMTEYEKKFTEQGIPIKYLIASPPSEFYAPSGKE